VIAKVGLLHNALELTQSQHVGPGHNMMRERADGATEESLTALQTIEERLAKSAEAQGLKLYAAQSNVEGEKICLVRLSEVRHALIRYHRLSH
jgi:3-dehydroquinate dehydratase